MNWSFILGLLVGGIVGGFAVAILAAGSKVDDRLLGESQYNKK
jgi:gas vesicle protein